MDPLDVAWERRRSGGFGVLFLGIALLVGLDLAADARVGSPPRHLLAEGGIFLLATLGAVWMFRENRRLGRQARFLQREAEGLNRDLVRVQAMAEAWKEEAGALVEGLAGAIDHQLERWGLSAAEQEVALLLLKGLSHKEIGELRKVSEATVRQQARNLYRKAGLTGRHDLAAFFLEDLLTPRGGRSGVDRT
ncbi:MAG TPA: LuxR C-terminal-related transcriptional regulator [Holophagaceae bacterium]|nr:LuxR C-terminal-related transcriptional regulator [Holophagaceae bacterium]